MTPFAGTPEIAPGWRVVSAHTDDPDAAAFENGTLSLDGNAGILLMMEREA